MVLISDTSTQWLEIPQTVHEQSWQASRVISILGNRMQAYLNQVCLQTVLPWLQERSETEPVVCSASDPGVWELVSGSAIALGDRRLILLPTEAMDKSELRVPQEWVDIPSWVGDYYLAIAVDTDEPSLTIWGYTTHERLKSQGQYDASDRTYSLDGADLIQDMTVFWVMQQLAAEPTRTEVPALPSLTNAEAETFIQRLADGAIALPRLEMPFAQWGAVLEQADWLQSLCARRSNEQGLDRQRLNEPRDNQSQQEPRVGAQPGTNLSQWLQNAFETGWQAIAELIGPEPDLAFSFRREDEVEPFIQRVKRIHLSAELPSVLLIVRVETTTDDRRQILVQVLPEQGNAYLPTALSLVLLSASGEVIQSVRAGSQSNYIQLRRFKCAPGTRFCLQTAVADASVTEYFVA